MSSSPLRFMTMQPHVDAFGLSCFRYDRFSIFDHELSSEPKPTLDTP